MKRIDSGLNLFTRILFLLVGALTLVLFSSIQKYHMGGWALVFLPRGYITPLVYGGLTGLLIGEWYFRQKASLLVAQESQAQLRSLIDAMPDFIISKDTAGRWVDANQAGLAFFGLAHVNYVGKTDVELIEQSQILRGFFNRCGLKDELVWQAGEMKRCSLNDFLIDGEMRSFDIIKVPMYGLKGERKRLLMIGRDVSALKESERKLQQAYDSTLAGWGKAVELRDKSTEDHTLRVVELTEKLAEAFGITGEALEHLRRGALLHDIGKISVPDSILHKPGPLTEDEWKIMRMHPENAYHMLKHIEFLGKSLEIAYCHHENWDGSGYPQGLQGAEIPLTARLFSVVDVWDALTNDRPYRDAWSEEDALIYIREQAGIKFDPEIVAAFLKIIEDKRAH